MIWRIGFMSVWCFGVLSSLTTDARAQDGKSVEGGDRVTPIVRVVQKCQGSVVAFINPKTGAPMGTGVVVNDRGFIVTNAHVVGKTKTWKIQLVDKTELTANVVSVIGDYDLAVAKVDTPQKLDILPPSKSDNVFLGEEVIAIGHPYGYSYTITRGILSGTGRDIPLPSGAKLVGVYQIDAAINPGNSGGPLMNITGELIGINFAMRSDAQSIAFTIPVKKVRELLETYAK